MQTFLLISTNLKFINSEIEKIKRQVVASPLDIYELKPAPSVSIENIRYIIQLVSKKTYTGGNRVIIIRGMESSTHEASNALLKILEEPPLGTYIIMTCDNLNKVLPTIISRSWVIVEKKLLSSQANKDDSKNIDLLKKIVASSPGARILLSQKLINSKEEALGLLDSLLSTIDYLIRSTSDSGLSHEILSDCAKRIIKARNFVDKNINFKVTIDILFLGLPKVKSS